MSWRLDGMRQAVGDTDPEIKAGDTVRVLSGSRKGAVGAAVSVLAIPGEGRRSINVLVTFPDGDADYFCIDDLGKVKGSNR